MKQNTRKTLRFFARHIAHYKGLAALMLFSLAFAVVAAMALPFFYKDFFNILTQQTGDKAVIFPQLLSIVGYVFIAEMIQWGAWRVAQFSNNYFLPRISADISNECFEYLHRHSYNFFNNNFSGALVKKVTRMARAFQGLHDKVYWDLTGLFLRVLIILGVLFYIHFILGLIILIWIIVFVFVNYFLSLYKLKFDLAKTKADTRVTAVLADTITNNVNVKLFSGLNFEKKGFKKVTDDWFSKTRKTWDIAGIIEGIQAFLMAVLNVLILYFAAKLWVQNRLTAGDFILIQAYLMEIFGQLWNFGRIIRELYEYLADAEEMTVILETPHEIQDSSGRRISVRSGKIEFQNVQFSYPHGVEVIRDLSFCLKPSEKVAFIGFSGGGKSTVIKLLLRLFDIQGGRILIDDQDIARFSQKSLHEQVALVPQDPILFHRTLLENIRYGRRDASDEEVVVAARLAHCDEFIRRFPDGYGTYVGERGVKLSGGERQRVAIARAILSNAPILLLDEATSSLDSESEMLIQEALLNLMKNKTTLVIAHRLSTIMRMDKVFVLQNGEIVEKGTHADLVMRHGGVYKRLWDLQVGGYIEQ